MGLTKEAPTGWADGRPVLICFLAVGRAISPVSPERRMLFVWKFSKTVGVVGVWQARQTSAGFRNVSMPLRTASSEPRCRQTLLPRPHSRKPPAAGTSLLDAGASCKGTPLRPPCLRISQDLQTARLAVPFGSLAGLDQEQKPERARRKAKGRIRRSLAKRASTRSKLQSKAQSSTD